MEPGGTGNAMNDSSDTSGKTPKVSAAKAGKGYKHPPGRKNNKSTQTAAVKTAYGGDYASTATLDSRGVIISTNSAWKSFAQSKILKSAASGPGDNYIEACENASGKEPEAIGEIASGIRSVLGGVHSEFSLEYSVGSPGGEIWFRTIVTSLSQDQTARILVIHLDVTDKKIAKKEARDLAQRLLGTIESITDGFFTLDKSWRFTYLNAEAERIFGRKRDRLLSRSIWEEFPAAAGTRLEKECRRTLTEGKTASFEEFYPALGLLLEVKIYPSAEGLTIYFRDATEKHMHREALRESEERFRFLAKATTDAIWDWDLKTNSLWWNEGFETLFGFAPNEIEPGIESWYNRIHPEDRERVTVGIHDAIDSGEEEWWDEYRFFRKDGSSAYVLDRGYIIQDDDGKPVRLIGGMTDQSERKRSEDKLREQAALLDKAQDAIIVRDLGHRILYWNRSAERLYGWSDGEAVGKSEKDLLHKSTNDYHTAMETTLARGEWTGEMEHRTRDNRELTVESRWTLVRNEKGEPDSILTINTDITARKKLEQQFLRAQRLESIGTLAGGIAHDLNNVLAPIMMSIGILKLNETDEKRLRLLSSIESSAQRGADMVNQVLSFARGVEGCRVSMNPMYVVRDIQRIINDTFPKNIDFTLTAPQNLWTVNADPTQLQQVLMNLCVNARDAMESGGVLTMTLENTVLDEIYSGMNPDSNPGPYVVITVEDTGTGIPRELRERIFDPFFTTKEVGKGTGLGLATGLLIVKAHGGFINLYSEIGKGSRFKVYLPATATPESAEKVAREQTQLPQGNDELILIADDEEGIRIVTEKTLERFGYRVLVAKNGAEAVALYAQHGNEVAAVLLDMAMPVMDGPSTIIALKAMNPKVRIIGSSGQASNGGVAKAVGAGVNHFVPKPYTAETLLKTLRELLDPPDEG